jgi:iron complex outermembrane receptor protein
MKKRLIPLILLCLIMTASPAFCEDGDSGISASKELKKLDDIVVEAKGVHRDMVVKPEGTVIDTDDHEVIGGAASVLDYLKAMAIIDFKGITDLTPDEDTIRMRDFSSDRFVTTIDGLIVQKTGGRKGSNIVDYALMPAFLIDTVEILPGPHWALYDARAIGGVVNMVTKAPKIHEGLKPDITLDTRYSSYNTLNSSLSMEGGAGIFTWDFGYQKNSTDGYLRQGETDIRTFFTRFGLILPYEGYVTLSGSYTTADRETPVNNNPDVADNNGVTGYDPDYPETAGSLFDPWQKSTWNKDAWAYRLNYLQKLPVGKLSFGAYTSKENRDRAYWDWVNASNHSLGTKYTSSVTTWRQHGGKIMDEITWSGDNVTTVGFDMAQLYDGDSTNDDGDKRVDKRGTFLQHRWGIIPALDLKLGLRYEDLQVHVSNNPASQIPDKGNWIVRRWGEFIPKSFLTWKMDGLGESMRDTTLSAGVSKIWHTPDAHGDYNPQGRPTGAWLEPEHGVGYDLIFTRRLFGDVNVKVDYSFYDINDYFIGNSKYARYSGGSAGNLRYSDYMINLDEVYRYGLETEIDGKITRDLSFYLTYAWQKFENRGDEPAGKDGLDNMAENRISAGLRYKLSGKTTLMLDYLYQSKEVIENSDEITDPVTHDVIGYSWSEVDNPAHHVFDIGVKQNLYKGGGLLRDATMSVYVKNLFDEDYVNTSGYPATDRTCGASVSLSM